MTEELHLFIIWGNAQPQKGRILNDIGSKFDVLEVQNIKWDEDNFSENMSRFYGEKLPSGSGKEQECGLERFTLVIVLDRHPHYEDRETSRGIKLVNVRMFDSKAMYREWTGDGHKIHATNNLAETKQDLLLLTGLTYAEVMVNAAELTSQPITEKNMDCNLMGCIQWRSLTELFNVLNETLEYVVLRNFEGMPEKYYLDSHGDIDILVSCPKQAANILNAKPVYRQGYRVHYRVNINHQTVRFDLRYLGDGYYDNDWEVAILANRVHFNGFYVPSSDDYKYSLLYHAIVHKKEVGLDYKEKMKELGVGEDVMLSELRDFMERNNYQFFQPEDHSVYFNSSILNQPVTFRRSIVALKYKLIDAISKSISPRLKSRLKRVLPKYL